MSCWEASRRLDAAAAFTWFAEASISNAAAEIAESHSPTCDVCASCWSHVKVVAHHLRLIVVFARPKPSSDVMRLLRTQRYSSCEARRHSSGEAQRHSSCEAQRHLPCDAEALYRIAASGPAYYFTPRHPSLSYPLHSHIILGSPLDRHSIAIHPSSIPPQPPIFRFTNPSPIIHLSTMSPADSATRCSDDDKVGAT